LMRFQYDPITDSSVKFNDRCEFPEILDLQEYIQHTDGSKDEYKYKLHAVLVHSGDNHGGHYVVFINPLCDGKWCKFDDDVVSRCTKKEAIQQNFGGDEDASAVRHCTNAYMLVYIQQSRLSEIVSPVADLDIPEALSSRLQDEKKLEAIRRKEKSDGHLYITVKVVLEDSFYGHQGNDLFDPETLSYLEFRVRKTDSLKDFMQMMSDEMKYPVDKIRPWPLSSRTNSTLRPTIVEIEDGDKTMNEVCENSQTWLIYLEMVLPDITSHSLPSFDKDQDVVLFFKYYCPITKTIHYMGHQYLSITTKLSNIIPKLCQMASIPQNSELILWEEIKPNMTEKIEDVDQPLEHVLEELMDGDIIVYQMKPPANMDLELPTAKEFYRDIYFKIEVNFCDKNKPNDPGFTLELSQRLNYNELAKRVAKHLKTSPELLQFFKNQSYRDSPGQQPLRCNYEGTLKDIIMHIRPKQVKRVFYQRLQISINELENKKQFKCSWISSNLKEEKELFLYPNGNATVSDLLQEALTCGQIEIESGGSGKLRLLEILSHKVFNLLQPEDKIESLFSQNAAGNKIYRLEEIPVDELELDEGEILVPVAHFFKEIYTTFGSPFLIKIKQGDTVENIRKRLQDRLGVPDKEWDKYRIAVVIQMKPHYLQDDNKILTIKEFKGIHASGQPQSKPWIGLEHINKGANKRSRYSTEKAIKIYN